MTSWREIEKLLERELEKVPVPVKPKTREIEKTVDRPIEEATDYDKVPNRWRVY